MSLTKDEKRLIKGLIITLFLFFINSLDFDEIKTKYNSIEHSEQNKVATIGRRKYLKLRKIKIKKKYPNYHKKNTIMLSSRRKFSRQCHKKVKNKNRLK